MKFVDFPIPALSVNLESYNAKMSVAGRKECIYAAYNEKSLASSDYIMIKTLIALLKCNDNGEPIIEAVWSTIYGERILVLSPRWSRGSRGGHS